jgi:acetyl-CoA acyltransferase
VIWGCVSQTGEQAVNVARNAALAAGWPEDVGRVTIDRQCGSSQQAVHFAAAGVISGQYDVAVAGGVESMSRVPMLCTVTQGPGLPFGPRMNARYDNGLVPQGTSAELIAARWGCPAPRSTRSPPLAPARSAATDSGAFWASSRRSGRDGRRGHPAGSTVETLAGLRTPFARTVS